MIPNIKAVIRFIAHFFISLLISPEKEITPKTLLLIRLDAIGDYLLFRNFIEVLKKSKKYKEYKITLLGNSVWKSLSEELDGEFVSDFIWLDRSKFNKDFFYRYKKLKEIVALGYDVALSPVYSREYSYGDTIVKLVNADDKIGSAGDFSNIREWQKNISERYYTTLVGAKNELMFEFNRNKEFFEYFLHTKIDLQKPTINLQPKQLNFELPDRYAIIFIGASASYRKWDIENFASVAKHLRKTYGYDIVLCGGPDDVDDAKLFRQSFKDDYLDLIGETTLLDLLYVIYNGQLMLSNETSAPHFAVALEMTNIYVIYNGNHYGRFTPYPKDMSENYHVIYHPDIEENLNDYQKLANSYGFGSDLDINEVSVKSVISSIDDAL